MNVRRILPTMALVVSVSGAATAAEPRTYDFGGVNAFAVHPATDTAFVAAPDGIHQFRKGVPTGAVLPVPCQPRALATMREPGHARLLVGCADVRGIAVLVNDGSTFDGLLLGWIATPGSVFDLAAVGERVFATLADDWRVLELDSAPRQPAPGPDGAADRVVRSWGPFPGADSDGAGPRLAVAGGLLLYGAAPRTVARIDLATNTADAEGAESGSRINLWDLSASPKGTRYVMHWVSNQNDGVTDVVGLWNVAGPSEAVATLANQVAGVASDTGVYSVGSEGILAFYTFAALDHEGPPVPARRVYEFPNFHGDVTLRRLPKSGLLVMAGRKSVVFVQDGEFCDACLPSRGGWRAALMPQK